jgi:hypothetical protein
VLAVAAAGSTAMADQVTVAGSPVYVTKSDCARLVEHRPVPNATYQPGTDVHGKYVAPADLPAGGPSNVLPDKVHFDVRVNPLTFSQRGAEGDHSSASGKYDKTEMPVAHVEVDLQSGQATFNGRPLTSSQDQALREACRKAH